MFNIEPNFDPSLPYGADLIGLGIEEPPNRVVDITEEGDEIYENLSACCGAEYIGETTLCSDCKEYG